MAQPFYTIPVASPEAAVLLIDTLLEVYQVTFKRKPSVDLLVSIIFGTLKENPRAKRLRKLGAVVPLQVEPDKVSVSIRLSDPENASQQWDAHWLLTVGTAEFSKSTTTSS